MLSEHIKAIANTLEEKPGFVYAHASELDQALQKQLHFPVVGMVPETDVELSFGLSHAMHDKYDVFIYFLYKVKHGATTAESREPYVKQAKELCSEFLVKLANYRFEDGKMFRVTKGQKVKFKSVYNEFSSVTAGGYITLSLQTMYDDQVKLSK